MLKIRNESSEAATAGIAAAKHLPARSSIVEIGVASSGSRLRVVFSPTMLYAAMVTGMISGIITKKSIN